MAGHLLPAGNLAQEKKALGILNEPASLDEIAQTCGPGRHSREIAGFQDLANAGFRTPRAVWAP